MSFLRRPTGDPVPRPLNHYRHRVRVTVLDADNPTHEMWMLMTVWFQLARSGMPVELHNVRDDGNQAMELTWETTCPEHDLKGARVVLEFSQAQRIDPGGQGT